MSRSLKVYVSVDLEGLPGISGYNQLIPGNPLYADARKVVTEVVGEAVRELRRQGFDVLVADSHGYMNNIIYPSFSEDALLLQGYPRPYSMVLGIESGRYSAAFFLGYHAAVGTPNAYLSHTMGLGLHKVKVNGEPVSEYYLNAIYAGMYGVPVALVAGDERLRNEVKRHTPWAVFVPLKKGITWAAAISPSLKRAVNDLREGILEACSKVKEGSLKPLQLGSPIEVEVEVRREAVAELAEMVPGAERIDAFRVRYVARDAADVMRFVELVALLSIAARALLK